MQERAGGAVHERRRLLERELAHVAEAEVEQLAARRPSIAGDESMPITVVPIACATGIATRSDPTASSTTGPSASCASST